jgi:self-protective colicin-like immunity protein
MVEKFIQLIKQFIEGHITTDDFENGYVSLWYENLDELNQDTSASQIISDLFLEVDAYSNQEPYNVSESQLRLAAQQAMNQLNELQKEHN